MLACSTEHRLTCSQGSKGSLPEADFYGALSDYLSVTEAEAEVMRTSYEVYQVGLQSLWRGSVNDGSE